MRLLVLCALACVPLLMCNCGAGNSAPLVNSPKVRACSAEIEREADVLLDDAIAYSRSELTRRLEYYPASDQSQPAKSGRDEIARDLKELDDAVVAARPRLLEWLRANPKLPTNEKARIAKAYVQEEIDK